MKTAERVSTRLWGVCGSRSSSNEGRTHTNTNEHTEISVA